MYSIGAKEQQENQLVDSQMQSELDPMNDDAEEDFPVLHPRIFRLE
jgi:hypothetical protein